MLNWSTGPSTEQTPYLVNLEPNIRLASVLSVGDAVGTKSDGVTPWVMVGIPDGLGAYDNGDGTITVLMNQELGATAGVVREHGSRGAFVSELVIDKATLAVLGAGDLGTTILQDNDGDGVYTVGTTALARLCSADLAPVSAFFYAGADGIEGTADDVGTQSRIFLNGEETGAEGRAWAWIATGAEKGNVYELPGMGNTSFENVLANPYTGAKTVVMATDDSTPGQVYLYVGDKQATGTEVEKAGLVGGTLYGIAATGIGNTASGTAENQLAVGTTPTSGSFGLVAINGANTMSGALIETVSDLAGVTEWWRPEDGAWDTINHDRFYFVTTAGTTSPSRLWALDFTDIDDPTAGGTFTMLLEGTEGQVMFDNLTVAANGHVIIEEDPGNFPAAAKVWNYDPVTDTLHAIAKNDPARFGDTLPGGGSLPATAPFTTDEENSGIIDVTHLLGDSDTQAFLLDTQAHYAFPGPLAGEVIEGGQLQVLFVDAVVDGRRGDDVVRGSYLAEMLKGKAGDDMILGGSGNDSLRGGDGDDVLQGGAGADVMNGGTGADIFLYAAAAEGGDAIRGFALGEDMVAVSASGFGGGLVAGALDAARFVDGRVADQAIGQFLYDQKAGELWWDADGTGVGAAVLIADFGGKPALSEADITVIA